jgi:hypothetical protein
MLNDVNDEKSFKLGARRESLFIKSCGIRESVYAKAEALQHTRTCWLWEINSF